MEKRSIHSFCWISGWGPDSAEFVAPRAASAGFNHVVVPLRDHSVIDPDAIARIFGRSGVTAVVSANQTPEADISSLEPEVRQRGMERHRASFRLARDMGAVHVGGITYSLFGKADRPASDESRKYSAEALGTLAEEAKPLGFLLAMEILNRYETNMLNTVDQGLAFLKMAGSDNLYLHLDTFHMNIEEVDMVEALEKALPFLAYFELDQNDRGLLDRGLINFQPMLTFLKNAGYDKLIGVEAFSHAVSGTDIVRGVSAWRDLFKSGDEVAASAVRVLSGL
jgi:D-psicose/D-tagatose/L-ribulose 3-epimerase